MTASKNTHLLDSLLPWFVVCTTLKLLDINKGIAIGIPLKNRLGGKACLPHFLRQIGNVFSLFRNGLVRR